jgi:D-alanyl-D-alanine carboxypeptidase
LTNAWPRAAPSFGAPTDTVLLSENFMIKKNIAAFIAATFIGASLMVTGPSAIAAPYGSQSVLVVEDGTGKILFEKNANIVMPIASLTKLMTAMVVLDAKPDMNAEINIDQDDVDTLKPSAATICCNWP